ncbi:MAG: dihydroorotate dehydrogenase electron transfer subunit [Bacteroidales bacterium]|nr:dihydroorotate dehydrogenase electron transfer subunit [Bacteroidales bacterium]
MKYCNTFIVEENQRLNPAFFKLRLRSEENLPSIKPGQFVEIEIPQPTSSLLRRPISIHDVDYRKNEISLLIQIAGKGTEQLSKLEKGEKVSLVYPLGNGFECEGEKVLLIGGGVGVAPLLHLAKCFQERNIRPQILLGYRGESQMFDNDVFAQYGALFISTQDGSHGEKGLVTEHSVFANQFDAVYTCGPTPMMRAVAENCEKRGIKCFVSLENKMACGIGACLCCVQQTTSGHKCTCTEGPVFNSKEIVW